MPPKNLAPKGKIQGLQQKLEEYAKAHSLFLNEKAIWKIEWMEEHEGRCFCDWENRKCPCEHVSEDLARFNGNCLCGMLCTEKKLAYFQKKDKPTEKPSEKNIAQAEVARRKAKHKEKESKDLFKRLFQKRRGKGF